MRNAIQRRRRLLAFVLVMVVVALAALLPALPRWAAARQEYPPGLIGKFRCLRDCLWLSYGGYHPSVDRIKLTAGNLMQVYVYPVRLDQRSSAGMGECASIGENQQRTVLAAWMMRDDRDGQTYKVYGRRLGMDGSPLGPDFRINTGLSSGMLTHHVSLRVDSQGWFYVLWHAARTTGQLVRGGAGVFVRIFTPDGRPAAREVLVSPKNSGEMPELAVGANGIAAAVWSDRGQVWGRLLAHDGPHGAAVRLDDAPTGALAEFPAAAFGTDGNLMAAWADTRTGGRDVYARVVGPDLQPRQPSIRAGDGPVPKAFFRLISVVGASTGYAVAWMSPWMIHGRWFNPKGNVLAGMTTILPAIAGVATLPQPDGSVIVSNGPSICVWRPGRRGLVKGGAAFEEPVALLPDPSRPCEIDLASGYQGIWIAWHDLIDARRIPALGDNFFIMAARVSLRR